MPLLLLSPLRHESPSVAVLLRESQSNSTQIFSLRIIFPFDIDLTNAKALFTFNLKPKFFQDSPSYRIFRHMHGVLNIDENKN